MTQISYELNVSLPYDVRLAELVAALVVHAARQAGYTDADASRLGTSAERVVRGRCETAGADAILPVIVRRHGGPVEVLIDHQVLTPDA